MHLKKNIVQNLFIEQNHFKEQNFLVGPNSLAVLPIIILIIVLLLIPVTSNAQKFTPRSETSFKVTANAGFFIPARSNMERLYGTSINTLGSIQYRLCCKFYVGAFAGYIEMDKGELYLKYRDIYFGPMATYIIQEGERHSLYAQMGIGLNYRKIHAYTNAYRQNDFGPSLNLGLGTDYTVAGPIFVGGKVIFDYTYDAEADQGDFGNTGGFNFLVNAGVAF